MPKPDTDDEFFRGLRELVDSAFPKQCKNCGREYRSSAEFLVATRPLRADSSGLKQSRDDDGQMIVDLFRNCICGSTLLESFGDRRNLDADGIIRRKRFENMVCQLVEMGCPEETARGEMLKLMRGQPNEMLYLTKLDHSRIRQATTNAPKQHL